MTTIRRQLSEWEEGREGGREGGRHTSISTGGARADDPM